MNWLDSHDSTSAIGVINTKLSCVAPSAGAWSSRPTEAPATCCWALCMYLWTVTYITKNTPYVHKSMSQQDAVEDGRLCPQCWHLANSTKHRHRLRFWLICSIMWKHIIHKTKVHNILHYCERTEPWLQVTRTENLVNYGHVVFETGEQTDRQTTNMLIAILSTPNRGKVVMQLYSINTSKATWKAVEVKSNLFVYPHK